MFHFFDTVAQILSSDSVSPLDGVRRHLSWQSRKVFRRFPVMLQIANSQLRVDQPCGVAALINAMGEYDHNNMRFLRSVVSGTRGTFVDIGANIGSYTLVVSEVSEATLVSIEPHPVTFGWLKENVRLNDRRNVACLNVAVSDQDGTVQLTDGADPSVNRVVADDGRNSSVLTVECRRVETLCADLKFTPDFVKIDVEGHEFAVLQGFGSYRRVPKVLVIEHGERRNIRDWMKADFAGPLFVHVDRRILSHEKQRRPEDPVYLNRDFLPQLRDLGFEISA